MNVAPIRELGDSWRAEAELLRRRGAPQQADALESAAEDLDRCLSEWELEALTVAQAVEESGYSESHLRNLLSEGDLTNVGQEGAPRIRRRDLPTKAGPPTDGSADDLAAEALRRRAG